MGVTIGLRDNEQKADTRSVANSDEFDAERFFEDQKRAPEEQEKVIAQRPSGEVLSSSLAGAVDLLYRTIDALRRIACLREGEDPESDYRWMPLSGSLGKADFELNEQRVIDFLKEASVSDLHWGDPNPTRNPTSWALEFVARCVYSAIDNLASIASLVQHGEQVRGPVTLARSALEALATACFVVDPSVAPDERLRRVMNLQFDEVKETSNGWSAESEERAEAETLLTELISFATGCGLKARRYDPERHHPPMIQGDQGSDATRQLIEHVLPGLGFDVWRSMSAVAHSRQSATMYLHAHGLPHLTKSSRRIETTAWHTLPVLLALHELCRRLDAFLGWDLSGWDDVIETVGTQWSIGAGHADDAIRQSLGLG